MCSFLIPVSNAAALSVEDTMPELKKRSDEFAMEIVSSKPEVFEQFIASEIRKWARVIADAKIQPE